MAEERGIVLPAGVRRDPPREDAGRVIVDNRTGLPDAEIVDAVRAHFVENASVVGANLASTFQTYANDGANFMTRARFQVPTSVFEEIKLARDLADKDDDVRATVGNLIAVAYSEGMENFHEDAQTVQLFNQVARNANLDGALKRVYREYLISGSVTTVDLFTREQFDYSPTGTGRTLPRTVVAPLVGVLQAEHIRVLDNDMFGTGTLGYLPPTEKLRRWLEEYFNPQTTAPRKAELGRQDRVSAAMFNAQIPIDLSDPDQYEQFGSCDGARYVYTLNPRMVHRLKMPCDGPYPRPLLTANFALLEAKRLLNIMDYALLQGGANFIVVAKVGSDQRPAQQPEVDELENVVRRASRTGVIVGDHRLEFDIITPKLDELLNPEKRKMLGRKLAYLLLRVADVFEAAEDPEAVVEIMTRVITGDRQDIKRHVEGTTYAETAKRNSALFPKGPPKLWHPKVILQGSQFFTDLVLKLRDRGDIPRKWAVEAGGFDYEAALAERKNELARGDDEVLQPGSVPFTDQQPGGGAGPQDNNTGRPRGSGPNNGRRRAKIGPGQDPARPRRTITRNAGETVKAWWDEAEGTTVRIGEQTLDILEAYPDYEFGRITSAERSAIDSREPTIDGPLAAVPVNIDEEVADLKALRLTPGLSMIVGNRTSDDAIMARALIFREPEFSALDAEERAMRWGFPVADWSQTVEPEEPTIPEETASRQGGQPALPAITVNLEIPRGGGSKRLVYDANGRLVGSEEADQHEPGGARGRTDHRPRGGLRKPTDKKHVRAYRYGGAASMDAEAARERALQLPAWHREWDQGHLDACVGYASCMAVSIINEQQARGEQTPPYTRRYEPVWLWNEARMTDEWTDNDDLAVNDGTSLRAAFDILREQGPRRWDRHTIEPADPSEGIDRNEWLTTVDDVRHCVDEAGRPAVLGLAWYDKWLSTEEVDGEPWIGIGDPSTWGNVPFLHAVVMYAVSDRRQAVRLKSSWGPDFGEPWMPYETLDYLFKQGEAEATCIVDR